MPSGRCELSTYRRKTSLFLPPCLWTLFGPDYVDGTGAFRLLILSIGLIFLHGHLHSIFIVRDQTFRQMLIISAGTALNIALNFLLIPAWGITGAAASTVIAEGLILLLLLLVICRTGVRFSANGVCRPVVAAAMMGAVLHTVNVRISPEQVLYTINHAEDDVILVNAEFLPILEAIHAKMRPGVTHAWHLYPIALELEQLTCDRARFIEELRAENIGTSVHFIPIHRHPHFRDALQPRAGAFPVADDAYARAVSLPMFAGLTERDVDDVCDAVGKVVSHLRRFLKSWPNLIPF